MLKLECFFFDLEKRSLSHTLTKKKEKKKKKRPTDLDFFLTLSFTLYTAPLEDIIEAHGFGRMIYANDMQVYVILKK